MEELEGKRRADIEAALIKHDIKRTRLNEEHAGEIWEQADRGT